MAGRVISVVPSLITACNVLAGLMAILAAIEGQPDLAVFLIFIGFFADTIDGPVARWLNATSDFGKALDSMGDLITFGVAPFVLLHTLSTTISMSFIAAVFSLAAVFRLARFDSQPSPPGQHLGLAAPFAAIMVSSSVALDLPQWLLAIVTVVCSILMVTTRRYLKPGTRTDKRELRLIWLVHLLALVVIFGASLANWLDLATISRACHWLMWALVLAYITLGGVPPLKL
ncbi:MAG: CDP-diacylglycerol--serine O-phosphatidyltransferase [Proteobacteria bacterium]|nr:CDP-diacylglycerol--serine O-phosphatidyltransferase [Pseudomonadota bacterium]